MRSIQIAAILGCLVSLVSGQTIYMAGDSTMAKGGGGSGLEGWGTFLGQYVTIPVVNLAVSGRSARSYTEEGRFATIIDTVEPGDFVIIEFGHNDVSAGAVDNGRQAAVGDDYNGTAIVKTANGTSIVIHTFNYYVENAINAVKAKGAIPIIASNTPNNSWVNGAIAAPARFVGYSALAASRTGISFVDHYRYTAQSFQSVGEATTNTYFPKDYKHPNPAGANVIAQAFVRGVACVKSSLAGKINAAGKSVPLTGSWFGPRTNEEDTDGGTTPRPSLSPPPGSQPPRVSTDKPTKRVFPAYTTPHDAVLSELHGTGPKSAANDRPVAPASIKDGLVPPDPIGTQRDEKAASPISQDGPRFTSPDLLLDPFDGSTLGVLIPHAQELNQNGEEQSPSRINLAGGHDGALHSNPPGSEAVWSHLSRVLDIQSEISKMHLEMESIGASKGGDFKSQRPKPSSHKPVVPEGANASSSLGPGDPVMPPGLQRPRQRAVSMVSTISSVAEGEDEDDEGVNVPDEEAEKARLREQEFAKLASQFEGRKDAIQGIMNKLDDLSKTLSEFHALQMPNFDFPASRNNSIGATTPPVPAASPLVSREGDATSGSVPPSQASAPTSNRPYGSSQPGTASSSLAVHPPPFNRSKSDYAGPGAPPAKVMPQKKVVPTVLINSISMDLEAHPHVMESPASTVGSFKLPPEE
ncbi:unnamed protein product [Cyclocybe aegerita]|uniref:Rhamnogalacturonan acetylesterase n=1 Tax=Cyclocybe aegerita TaxID=1973307 RepID=A0A8S0WDI2_CYCAE|nr:unnamed protein product [Cyclocybe aegerita]